MEISEEMNRIVELFADHFISSKNITFLRHIAFLPFDKTKLIEMDFLTEEVSPKEVASKTILKTIQYYKEMVTFEISNAGLSIEKLKKFSIKLTYKPGDLTRYYTGSVVLNYDGKDYTKSVLSSFS
jgi:hypothetical protein